MAIEVRALRMGRAFASSMTHLQHRVSTHSAANGLNGRHIHKDYREENTVQHRTQGEDDTTSSLMGQLEGSSTSDIFLDTFPQQKITHLDSFVCSLFEMHQMCRKRQSCEILNNLKDTCFMFHSLFSWSFDLLETIVRTITHWIHFLLIAMTQF